MATQTTATDVISLVASNVGGIDETEVNIPPGVTILTGRNATNRTSFLRALMAALGSTDVSVKGDATEGRVRMQIGDETYARTLRTVGTELHAEGDPYLEDSTLADLFAFLLETNEARQAVARGLNLREIIMRPVDMDVIEERIQAKRQRQREIEDELSDLEELKRELPGLESEREELESGIEEKRSELADKETQIEELDADIEQTTEEKSEVEEQLEQLHDTRAELEEVRYDIDSQKESIESLRANRAELETELEALPETSEGAYEDVDEKLRRLRDEKRTLQTEVDELQSVIQFNEDVLRDSENTVADAIDSKRDDGDLTDALLEESETVTCWTCGSETDPDAIEETIHHLRTIHESKYDEISELDEAITAARERRQTLEDRQKERERLESNLRRNETELERREETLEDLRSQRDELSAAVERLESEVEERDSTDFSGILDLHKEANQIEYEIGRLEAELEDVEARIEEIENRLDGESELNEEFEQLDGEITDLRTHIDRTERDAVEAFNSHMDELLEILDYGNLERIWIERVHEQVREGRRTVEKTAFDLHIVRSTESGATYEDVIDHLSESEREVTGLVFALAGYLVHEVHEMVPVMVLDSLEAIDSDRIASLVDYLSEFSEYLVVALLPEDSQALDDDYNRVRKI